MNIIRLKKLGEGAYGKVYSAKYDDTLVAVKRNYSELNTSGISNLIELDMLNKLRDHPMILKNGEIKGAGLDVYENEPKMAAGLAELPNTVLTPHTASATEETRSKMSELAAENIIAALEGKTPPALIK